LHKALLSEQAAARQGKNGNEEFSHNSKIASILTTFTAFCARNAPVY